MHISPELRDYAEMVATALSDTEIFYRADGRTALVLQDTPEQIYLVSVYVADHGEVHSMSLTAPATWETGWEA